MPTAEEDDAPVNSLDVVARNLRERFDPRYVSFLFVDVVGRRLLRMRDTAATCREEPAVEVALSGQSVYDEVESCQRVFLVL